MIRQKHILTGFSVITICFVSFAIIGGMKNYSFVPFQDMWNGYLDFFMHVSNGDWHTWWAPHNEHRIVLARIFFWLDLKFFQGTGIFLIIINYLLASTSFIVLYCCLKNMLNEKQYQFTRYLIGLVILCLSFSWIQSDNFIYGFQVQFFLAQLLPLTAFYLLYLSSVNKIFSTRLFFLACFAGIAALGSMANDIITLPLMTCLAVILHMRWPRIILLLFLSILLPILFFYHYNVLGKNLLPQNLSNFLNFILFYFGGPFYYIFHSEIISKIAGIFFLIATLVATHQAFKISVHASLQHALLTFIFYIGISTGIVALGRSNSGIQLAYSSRYMTPVLMAWSVLLIFYARIIAKKMLLYPIRISCLFFLLLLILLSEQLNALKSHQETLFDREIAALAIALHIQDQQQISTIFPSAKWALNIAEIPIKKNLSVFNNPLIKNAAQLIGSVESNRASIQCIGTIEKITRIADNSRYLKIEGFLLQPKTNAVPKIIHILDKNGFIIGYALTGQFRHVELPGWRGYVLAKMINQPVILKGFDPDCELKILY